MSQCVCVCSAGAGRTGTFCALSTVLERVKAEGILDVFQTVKSLRLQRPHMVQTLVSRHNRTPVNIRQTVGGRESDVKKNQISKDLPFD